MSERKIAILVFDRQKLSAVRDNLRILAEKGIPGEITVFSEEKLPELNGENEITGCCNDIFPECAKPDFEASRRNAVLKKYINDGYRGILHVMSDGISLLKDPSEFIKDLEQMMSSMNYPIWMSTVTDPCNYVYGRYNPRCILKNDIEKSGITYSLAVTSHSNTCWMAYDLGILTEMDDIAYFSENFKISMFYIIEFLARRRNLKRPGQPFYMNQYLTVESEYGTFKNAASLHGKNGPEGDMQSEGELFKSMRINHEPDVNIDAVLDVIADKFIKMTGFVNG